MLDLISQFNSYSDSFILWSSCQYPQLSCSLRIFRELRVIPSVELKCSSDLWCLVLFAVYSRITSSLIFAGAEVFESDPLSLAFPLVIQLLVFGHMRWTLSLIYWINLNYLRPKLPQIGRYFSKLKDLRRAKIRVWSSIPENFELMLLAINLKHKRACHCTDWDYVFHFEEEKMLFWKSFP